MAMSPLFRAVNDKDLGKVEELLAGGGSVQEKRSEYETLLSDAIRVGSLEVVSCLLKHGADPNEVSGNPKGERSSPLILASKKPHLAIVKLLLGQGAEINFKNKRGESALYVAVSDRTKEHLGVMGALLEAGADVNLDDAITPLMKASQSGSAEMVATLIQHGARVNTKTSSGTALRCAIDDERAENIQVLLANGADVHSVAYYDQTPLEIAKKVGNKKVIKLIEEALTPGSAAMPAADTRSFAEIVSDFEHTIGAKHPNLKATLREAASQDAFDRFAKVVGVSLPADLREYCLIHDGQVSDGAALFPSIAGGDFWLMSVGEMTTSWADLKTCLDAGDFNRAGGPDRGVQDDWWRPEWIPFAGDGGGDFLCIDLAPAPGGAIGQIVSFRHEESARERVAPSLAALLAGVAAAMQAES